MKWDFSLRCLLLHPRLHPPNGQDGIRWSTKLLRLLLITQQCCCAEKDIFASLRRRKIINWRLIDFSSRFLHSFVDVDLTTPTFFPSAQFALFPWKKRGDSHELLLFIIYFGVCLTLEKRRFSLFLLSEWHWLSFIIKRAEKAKASQQRSTWDCFRSRLGSIFSIISVHSLEGGFSWYFIIMGFLMTDARRLIAKEDERDA